MRRLVGLVLAIVMTGGCASVLAAEPQTPAPTTQPKKPPTAKPNPKLGPGDVVKVVVEALKTNDAADGGIAVAFDFASPANREATGPLKRFIPMVKSPDYKPLLNHKVAKYDKVQIEQNKATQMVGIKGADDKVHLYLFALSKQAEGEFAGCWMTDGVVNIKAAPDAPDDEPPPAPKREEAPAADRA